MALTLKIFENERDLARLAALDYIPLEIEGGDGYPIIETVQTAIREKISDLIDAYVKDCMSVGMSYHSACADIANKINDLLGCNCIANSFDGVLSEIMESPQLFFFIDRIGYNINEVKNEMRTSVPQKEHSGVPKGEKSMYDSFMNAAKRENLLSYLELLAEQNI